MLQQILNDFFIHTKINKDRIIIESELYSDYSKIVSPIFELRCSLNENEAAEILKKSLIRSDFLK